MIRQQVALDLQGKNEAPSFLHLGSLFAVHCKAKSFACRIGHDVSVSSQKDINTGVAPSICDFHSTEQYILPDHIPAILLTVSTVSQTVSQPCLSFSLPWEFLWTRSTG